MKELLDFNFKIFEDIKSFEELFHRINLFFKESTGKDIEIKKLEEIKESLSTSEIYLLVKEKKYFQKENKLYMFLFEGFDTFYIGVIDNKEKEENIIFTYNILKLFLKPITDYFKFSEEAKKEITKNVLLFAFYRAFEVGKRREILYVLEDIKRELNLEGIAIRIREEIYSIEIEEKVFSKLDTLEIKDVLKGDKLILNGEFYHVFGEKGEFLVIKSKELSPYKKEFLSSIFFTASRKKEELSALGSFTLVYINKIFTSDYKKVQNELISYLKNEFHLINPLIIWKQGDLFYSFPKTENLNTLEEKWIKGKKLNTFFRESSIFAENLEETEIPLRDLSFIVDMLYLKERNDKYLLYNKLLSRIFEVFVKVFKLEDFLYEVCKIIKEEAEIHYSGILLKENEEFLRMVAGVGYEDYDKLIKIRLKIGVEGLSGYVARTGEKLYIPDVSKDLRYYEASPKVKSELVLPLKYQEEIMGVIVLSSERLNGFTEDDILCFEKIANILSFKIKTVKDIKSIQEEIRKAKEEAAFIEIILRNIPVGVIYATRDLVIQRFNRACLFTLGVSKERLEGEKLCAIFEKHEPGSPDCIFERSITNRVPLLKYNVDIERDGKKSYVSLTSSFVYEGDNIKGILLMLEDIGEIVALEEQLRRTERLSAIGRIAAHMAHEIKNPLASISVGIEYIYSTMDDRDPKKKHLEVILKEIQRVDRLIKNLLSFARRPPLKRKRANLKEILEELVILHSHEFKEKNINIHLKIPEGDIFCLLDVDQIKEVFENLVRNAIEAMPEGGDLYIRLEERPGGTIRVEIEDTGVGIEPSELQRIFEPFYTTKKGGSGLGLPIAHRIVEDHGGRMTVDSEKGKGTKFAIELSR